jgi:epoxide hydrolase 4
MGHESWQHGFAELETGVRLHYVTAGTGPLVLLLHGFPECWWSWRHQIPPLARHFRVVAPDLRGYGQSDKPPGVSAYRLEHLTADVAALIRHFGRAHAHIVGHDWGAAIAWAFADAYAQQTASLCVMNCPPVQTLGRHVLTGPRQLARSWYILFFQIPWLPERALLRDPAATIRRLFRGNAVDKSAFSDQELAPLVEAISQPGAVRAALGYYRAAAREALRHPLQPEPRIGAPTLVLWAEEDKALGKELTLDFERLCTGAFELRYVPRCGHFLQQEQPGTVSRHLLDFLQRQS